MDIVDLSPERRDDIRRAAEGAGGDIDGYSGEALVVSVPRDADFMTRRSAVRDALWAVGMVRRGLWEVYTTDGERRERARFYSSEMLPEAFVIRCGKCGAIIPKGVDRGHAPCDA